MLTYILRRLGLMVFILLGVSVITFSIMHLMPGDPAEVIVMERYGKEITAETIEFVCAKFGLDQPVYIQYFNWLTNVLRGDLGYSFRTDRPVLGEILARLPATIQLALAGMLIALIIAIPVGIISAITLGTGMAAITTCLIRSSMLEVLGQDYIRTARAKGLKEKVVIYKHALKNAMIPVVTIVGLRPRFSKDLKSIA
jgi:peptide/nickel transport system permease protein